MSDIGILCSHCGKTFGVPRWVIKQIHETITMPTPIPIEELVLFKFLSPDIDVIFDVGARTDLDYKHIKPSAICHLFEPAPEFFKELETQVHNENLKDVYLNNYGMSDVIGSFYYDPNLQTFRNYNPDPKFELLPVRTIDWYAKNNGIERIDFLKMDTEGWDYKVIEGAKSMWSKIKYMQYEHWNDDQRYRNLVKDQFECEYVGYRNGLCMNKALLSEERRAEVIKYIRDNKLGELA